MITDRGLKYIEFMGKSEKSTRKSLLPDKEEAFAASVGGLAKMIAKAGCEVEQGKSDHTAKLESEITGRMCACCEGCVICGIMKKDCNIRLISKTRMEESPRSS